MRGSGLGIALALGACVLWSLSPFFFTATGRRIGPFATNLTRLLTGSILFAITCALYQIFRPGNASLDGNTIALLAVSGVIGLAVGDHFLYRSLSEMGPERTSLVMTLSPVITAFFAWIFLDERHSLLQLDGMAMVIGGVLTVTWPKNFSGKKYAGWGESWNGIVAALLQGASTVLVREAFLKNAALNPLFATAIRVGAGALVLVLTAVVSRSLLSTLAKTRHPGMAPRLLYGTLTGPVVGMLCYIGALKYQSAGIVSTITFMTPLLIIPLAAWRYKARLNPRILLGGAAALAGVALLGWNP